MTFFCINGHLVEDSPHHGIPNTEVGTTVCSECGSKDIKVVSEWRDSDYEGSDIVPASPLRYDTVLRTVNIPIYDVSKLFSVVDKKKMTVNVAINKLLDWLYGFEESTLYQDYKQDRIFTDEDWDEVIGVLLRVTR